MIVKIATSVRAAFIWAILASATALAQSNPVPFIDQPLVPMGLAPWGRIHAHGKRCWLYFELCRELEWDSTADNFC
jgi:hypothetical protein